MPAIAGLVYADGRTIAPETLAAMADAAVSRGSDGITTWRDQSVGLIRFAHATTPEAVGEVQPFHSRDSRSTMLFDGRLDNRSELAALIGDRFQPGMADGALALALHDRLGDAFVARLAGDFAIALWQPDDRCLTLFRSAFGWRPLLWTVDRGRLAFATEPRTLIVGLGLESRLNEGAICEYLAAHFATDTETFWSGIERVEQGGAVTWHNGQARAWTWHGGPFEDLSHLSMADHVDRFQELFDQALIAANRSNGPVTAQLSGGLDSSSVVCRSTELFRAGRVGHQVIPISARFPGEAHDESGWSGAVESHLGVEAQVAARLPFDADAARQWSADTLQLPLRPNALDSLGGVAGLLQADGRRVLLTGEGGDDWLAGSLAHWPDLLSSGRWADLWRHGRMQWPDASLFTAARRTLKPALLPLLSRRHRNAVLWPQFDPSGKLPDWIRPDWARQVNLRDRTAAPSSRHNLRGMAQKSRYGVFQLARRHVLWDPALAFAERHGIEIRHPLHDLRLAHFFMGVSGEHLRTGRFRKLLLREAMRGTLPERVRTRTDKAVFLNHIIDSVESLFQQCPPQQMLCARLGWIDGDAIERMHQPFRAWRASGSTGPTPMQAYGPVWFALAMEIWLKHGIRL